MKIPTNIEFKNRSAVLQIDYEDGSYELPYEFLRVFSPSADVQGHTPDQAKLQVGKKGIKIVNVEPVGEYALKIVFSDGHDSGLYSWEWLEELGKNKDALWEAYLKDLAAAGASRDPDDPANEPFKEKKKKGCPNH